MPTTTRLSPSITNNSTGDASGTTSSPPNAVQTKIGNISHHQNGSSIDRVFTTPNADRPVSEKSFLPRTESFQESSTSEIEKLWGKQNLDPPVTASKGQRRQSRTTRRERNASRDSTTGLGIGPNTTYEEFIAKISKPSNRVEAAPTDRPNKPLYTTKDAVTAGVSLFTSALEANATGLARDLDLNLHPTVNPQTDSWFQRLYSTAASYFTSSANPPENNNDVSSKDPGATLKITDTKPSGRSKRSLGLDFTIGVRNLGKSEGIVQVGYSVGHGPGKTKVIMKPLYPQGLAEVKLDPSATGDVVILENLWGENQVTSFNIEDQSQQSNYRCYVASDISKQKGRFELQSHGRLCGLKEPLDLAVGVRNLEGQNAILKVTYPVGNDTRVETRHLSARGGVAEVKLDPEAKGRVMVEQQTGGRTTHTVSFGIDERMPPDQEQAGYVCYTSWTKNNQGQFDWSDIRDCGRSLPTTASAPTTTTTATTAKPKIASATAKPTTASTTAESTAASTTAEPTAASTTAEPTAASTTAEPTAASTTAEPTAASTTAEPTAASTTAEPTAASTTAEPTAASTTAEPTTAPRTTKSTIKPVSTTIETVVPTFDPDIDLLFHGTHLATFTTDDGDFSFIKKNGFYILCDNDGESVDDTKYVYHRHKKTLEPQDAPTSPPSLDDLIDLLVERCMGKARLSAADLSAVSRKMDKLSTSFGKEKAITKLQSTVQEFSTMLSYEAKGELLEMVRVWKIELSETDSVLECQLPAIDTLINSLLRVPEVGTVSGEFFYYGVHAFYRLPQGQRTQALQEINNKLRREIFNNLPINQPDVKVRVQQIENFLCDYMPQLRLAGKDKRILTSVRPKFSTVNRVRPKHADY